MQKYINITKSTSYFNSEQVSLSQTIFKIMLLRKIFHKISNYLIAKKLFFANEKLFFNFTKLINIKSLVMKLKNLLLIITLSSLYSATTYAQLLVSHDTLPKNVVLEEFTGYKCQYCPDGHARAQAISDNNPNRVVLVNIHQGTYAVPTVPDPDYRTSFGDPLAAQSGIGGYPCANVNRHYFSSYSDIGGTSMNRGYWAAAASIILGQTSPVNVGISSSFDSVSRLLTVTAELFYTANSSQSTNYLNIALLENNIISKQNVLGSWNYTYQHNHMLRHLLTGTFGDTINTTTAGTYVQRIYTYTVPAGYNIENCDVAAYISETHQEIYTGNQVKADGGTTLVIGYLKEPAENIVLSTESDTNQFSLAFCTNLSTTENYIFKLNEDAPDDWSVYFKIDTITCSDSIALDIVDSSTFNIELYIIPGNSAFITTASLTVYSPSNPGSPVLTQELIVISNVTDLIINNDEMWGDGSTISTQDFEQKYNDGLTAANNSNFTATSKTTFMKLYNAGKHTEIGHIYYNVGWSFPSLTNELVTAFSSILNNGGNLFISGQDIAWDTWDANGTGSSTTKTFFTNYLNASFVNDGGSANSQFTPLQSDSLLGLLGTSSIVNVYGGSNFYPDQINPTGIGIPVFCYNGDTSKIGGVRATNGTWKTVYLGTSLEMISDDQVRNNILVRTHNWFHGMYDFSISENTNNFSYSIYPNPGNEYFIFNSETTSNFYSISIFNIYGKLIAQFQTNSSIKIETSNWNSGLYNLSIYDNQSKKISNEKLLIMH